MCVQVHFANKSAASVVTSDYTIIFKTLFA